MYVCVCKGVTFSDAVEAAKTRGASPEALMKTFGFDDGDACGRCADHIAKISVLVRLVMDKSKRDLRSRNCIEGPSVPLGTVHQFS